MVSLEKNTDQSCKDAFDMFSDKDGYLNRVNLGNFLRALGHCPSMKDLQVVDKGVTRFNYDNAMRIKGKFSQKTLPDITDAFQVFDKDGTGYISVVDMKHILTNFGEPLNDDEIETMLRQAEPKDGKINYKKYAKFLEK